MFCDYCLRSNYHEPSCPNYIPPVAIHYCSICGKGIYEGEEYIKNENGDYGHFNCFFGTRDLLDWLGYEIKIMVEN